LVPRNASRSNRRTAERVAEILLQQLPDVEAICLYGSVARGDDDSTSDIDLLVLGSEAVSRQDALAALPDDIPRELLSINCCTRAQLEEVFQYNPSFAVHIVVESVVLGDRTGFLERLLSRPVRDITADDLRRATRRLDQFQDLTRFNDDFLCCLSDLYMTGRLVITLSLLKDHIPIFEFRRAFATWRQLHPAHSAQVMVIEQLAPFYLLARRSRVQPLPFSAQGSSEEVARAVAAIRSIAGA
jgi:predicted nucleotidyltransferase